MTRAPEVTGRREVYGYTAPGFEAVRDTLADAKLDDGGGAFAALVAGELVVDLWAGQADVGSAWQADTVACAYSASKGVVTSCLVLLHHEGLLDLDAPVARYWPEFAACGKDQVTVRQLLSHGAGLVEVPDYQGFLGVHGENWGRLEEIRERLAGARPAWAPGTAHGYHGLTFGYLAGGLIDRVGGTTLTGLLQRLTSTWELDLRFGVFADTDGRRATQLAPAPLSPQLEAVAESVRAIARDPSTWLGKAFWAQDGTTVLEHLVAAGTDPLCMNVGAGNGDVVTTARDLAGLYHRLAAGELRESLLAFAEVQSRGPDLVLGVPATWCVGFQGNDVSAMGGTTMGPGARTFGHQGAGGQLGGYDPDRDLAFGFLRNQLSTVSTAAPDLVTAVTAAIG